MAEYYKLKVKKQDLENHVKRICRSNLKRPVKICTVCPFLDYVLDIMDSYGWTYNKEGLQKAMKRYQSSGDS